jgi:hypothetical protein
VTLPKSAYPKNWKAISAEVRERAKNADGISQCECMGECGLHRTTGGPRRCIELHRHPAKWAKGIVTLTTAHLCHKPKCARRKHLKAMCNRCHLRYDVKLHIEHRRQNREKATGQLRIDLSAACPG